MTAIELLEQALKTTRRRQMTRCQVLVLIALAKAGKPLQLYELTADVCEHRQTVQKAVEAMEGREIRVERPSKVQTLVHLRQQGVEVLVEILKTEGKS